MQFPINKEWQIYSFPNFTGGLASTPAQDNEAQELINMEPMRDGRIQSIYGSKKCNSNDISNVECIDVYAGNVYNNAFCLIAATADPAVYAWTSTSFCPSFPQTFTDISAGGLVGDQYWSFCQASDTSNNQIILMCNYTDGLFKWDNGASSSSMQAIGAAPSSPIAVCQYQGYTVVCKENSVFFSDYADPETWPGAQEIELSGGMGEVVGIAPVVGRLLVVCKRGLLELRGNTFADLSEPIPINTVVGSAFPRTISAFGNEVAFLHYTGPYILDTGSTQIQYIGEPIKEFFTSLIRDLDLSDSAKYYWRGHLTKHHYILTGRATSNIDQRLCFIFDRRLNAWYEIYAPEDVGPWSFTSTETCKVTFV